MKKVFISTSSFGVFTDKPLELLNNKGFDVDLNPYGKKLSKSQCLELYYKYDGIIAGTEVFDAEVLDKASMLKVISRVGIGVDNIDLDYARTKNIEVHITNTSPALSVAELSVGLMLDLLRLISIQNEELKSGIWKKRMGGLLSGKTLGIIGLGNIGKKVIELTKGFSMKYLAHDIYQDKEFSQSNNIQYTNLKELLERSDLVSIHLSLNEQTRNLISFEQMKNMKPHALIVNASRGGIINEHDLLHCLDENIIGGAALDVYDKEPYNGPLLNAKNILLTPHIGSYAKEIRVSMEEEATEKIIKTLKEE